MEAREGEEQGAIHEKVLKSSSAGTLVLVVRFDFQTKDLDVNRVPLGGL